ncbi:MAG TPA: hypothetical protein VI391_04495 [Thermoanaerobaculia bacterium]
MKRIVAAASLFTIFATCEPPIRRVVVLTFNEPADRVTLSATTALGRAKAGTPEAARIATERDALLAGTDEWSVRFQNADPESDRVILQRQRGELRSLEHVASIAPENLQKFFFDTPLTVTFTRSEGTAELAIYPGTSDRATRRQRDDVERTLDVYSHRAARYFQAVRGLYAYLDEKPRRAADMFSELFRDDKDSPPRVSENEEKLLNGVRDAMDGLTADDINTEEIDRDFDAAFNPFPAELRVFVAGDIVGSEGFTRMPDRGVAVKVPTALEAIAMLEGRWITPDPLAAILNAPRDTKDEDVAAALASAPRHTEPVVTPSEIGEALVAKMKPASVYRVRWIVTRSPAP